MAAKAIPVPIQVEVSKPADPIGVNHSMLTEAESSPHAPVITTVYVVGLVGVITGFATVTSLTPITGFHAHATPSEACTCTPEPGQIGNTGAMLATGGAML